MDVVSSVAAVVQLLAQVIDLWQQIDMARQHVKAAPKVFNDTIAHISNLSDIIHDVEREPRLHTTQIHEQVRRIDAIVTELHQILAAMETRLRKSTLRQGLRALGRGTRDEAKLEDVLKRLESAKAELTLRINVVHVGLTGEIAEEMGRFAQGAEAGNNTRKIENELLMEGNESWDHADQLNGIVGIESASVPTTARVIDNRALGNGRQKNLIFSGSHLLKIL
ncbi:hypothetical protein DL769_001096 [Monosporascus sp. CRB-8-3]|nr:hypothetical protein DL769_001096 [Monosporascus sp. CRB-8-3]